MGPEVTTEPRPEIDLEAEEIRVHVVDLPLEEIERLEEEGHVIEKF